MLGRLIAGLVGVIGALWLGIAGFAGAEWWEHRPHGEPAWLHIHVLFWTWSPPDSLQARLDALQAAEAAAGARARALETREAKVTAAIGDQDVVAQAQIRTVYKTLIQEVPVHVDQKAVADCVVPVGFVRLFNAGANGLDVSAVPDPAGRPDDAPSGVGLDTVARVTLGNDAGKQADDQQLLDLQAWVRAQQALNPPK